MYNPDSIEEQKNIQIKLTEQGEPTVDSIYNAMKRAKESRQIDKLILFAIKMAKLRFEESINVNKIIELAKEGGKEKIENTIEQIKPFTVKTQFIFYLNLLHQALFNENSSVNYKKEITHIILTHLDENLIKDTSLLNWSKFISLFYMFKIMVEIVKLDLNVDILLKRAENIEADIIQNNLDRINFTDKYEIKVIKLIVDKIYKENKENEVINTEIESANNLEDAYEKFEALKNASLTKVT